MEEYFKYNPEESFDSFVNKSLKTLGLKNLNPKLNFSKNNILPLMTIASKKDENFVIEIKEGENNYFEFIIDKIPKTFSLKYGCELETCFNLDCTTDIFNNFFRSELDKFKDSNTNPGEEMETWIKLIQFHLKINIIPFLSKTFLKRFRYAYIMDFSDSGKYIDLSNGEDIIYKQVDTYKTLRFEQDGSVKCGDTNFTDTSLTVHCEIVSPILNSLSDIKLIYDNIISKSCNTSNFTAGFHVNVSVVDEEDKPVKLHNLYKFEFANHMYKFEKENYKKYRGSGTFYAQSISKFFDENLENLILKYIKKKDGTNASVEEFIKDYGIKNLYYPLLMNNKYVTIHHKNEFNIFEFRIYPSKNDKNLLISYTQEALNMMEKSMKIYINDYERIYNKYNEIYDKFELQIISEEFKNYIETFPYFNFEGKIEDLNKLYYLIYFFKIYYISDDENFFGTYYLGKTMEMEKETIMEVPFLFFFRDVRKIKEKIEVEGIKEGTHIYKIKTYLNEIEKIRTLEITYNKENEYVKIINL